MTPPMPTSAEAVTRAYTTQETCQAARHTITGMCAHCVALALDAFARERCDNGDREWEKICREREAAVWKEAYEEFNYLVRSRSLWTPQFGEVLKKFHEARAGEERGTP